MGTRGVWGFRKGGHTIAVYHHFDSYPEGLGRDFFNFVKLNEEKGLLGKLFDNIVEIDSSVKPTPEQRKYCVEMGWIKANDNASGDWYWLLHDLQEPENWQYAVYNGKKVLVHNEIDFLIRDSLFCEFGYIYDIDEHELEFYEGFQHVPQENNPYGCEPNDDGYYPCRLLGKIPMDKDEIDYIEDTDAVGWMKIQSAIHNKGKKEE